MPSDVRMRGFERRSTVDEAVAWVDEHARPLPSESVSLESAYRRVSSVDVPAAIDVPAFDRSAMDGYAVVAEETVGAGEYNPLSFRVVGESLPGRPSDVGVESGTAVRIMTGAPVPVGATAVVPAEYASESEGLVELTTAIAPGKNVGRVGEDVRTGDVLLPRGSWLRPQDVGLLASTGVAEVEVVRRPRVRLVVTGDELVRPGEERGPYAIFESNSFVVRSLVERDGGVLESQRDVVDDREAVREAVTDGGADVVLVSGGSSVGCEDHAPNVVAEAGELAIHGVAMRPSSPAGLGRVGELLVFLLPGNPVSCLCAYDFFGGRAIRRMAGRSGAWPYEPRVGTLSRKIASAVGRTDYCRVRFDDEGRVEPLALSGASILSSTVRADGFVVVPAECEGYAADATVEVHCYEPRS